MKLVRRVLRYELSIYRSLFRWLTRRPDVPAGTVPVPYAGAIAPILWAFIVVSAVELVALHLLLPWPAVRMAADVLSAWGLVWMVGLLASLRMHPHLMTDDTLTVRYGATRRFELPRAAISSIAVRERAPAKTRSVQFGDGVLSVVIGGRTNVDVLLAEPLVVGDETVGEMRLFADDAKSLASALRQQATRS